MDSNACEIIPGPLANRPTNLKTDENSMRIQEDEVSSKIQTTNYSLRSGEKNTEKSDVKLPLNRKKTNPRQVSVSSKVKITDKSADGKNSKKSTKSGNLSLKKRDLNRLPTSHMVMEAIKALKKRNGASVEAILEYMECQYKVDAKVAKRYVTRYLKSAVNKAVVEQFSGGEDGRFKIKKVEKVTKIGQASGDVRRSKIKKTEKASIVRRASGMDGRSKIKKLRRSPRLDRN